MLDFIKKLSVNISLELFSLVNKSLFSKFVGKIQNFSRSEFLQRSNGESLAARL